MRAFRTVASVAWLTALAAPAVAFEPMEGCFVADAVCPALASIRKESNPGGLATETGRSYELQGANQEQATHFQIRIEGANPPDRWVEAACGRAAPACAPAGPGYHEPVRDQSRSALDNVLAASWQPAFCEGHRRTSECRSQTAERFDGSHFALHGLWPQPRGNIYCGASGRDEAAGRAGRWDRLPAVRLGAATRTRLERVMPGTLSHLERHEWIKHGTCYGETPAEYFEDSLQLMAELNASAVRDLFARRIGRQVSLREVRAAFDRAFGQGAGRRVEMICERGLIAELRIHLRGEITAATTLAGLLAAAPSAGESCSRGEVDAAGFR